MKIGMVYQALLNLEEDDLEHHNSRWTDLLGLENGTIDIRDSILWGEQYLLSANLKAQNYKMLFNLYYTPLKLFKWGKRADSKCPRCAQPEADSIHMFAVCSSLTPYWVYIYELIGKMLATKVQVTTQLILFGMDGTQSRHPLLFLATVIGRIIIAAEWKQVSAPSVNQWRNKLLACYYLEGPMYAMRGKKARKRGELMWRPVAEWLGEETSCWNVV